MSANESFPSDHPDSDCVVPSSPTPRRIGPAPPARINGEEPPAGTLNAAIARRVLRQIGSPPLELILPGGESVRANGTPPRCRIVIRDRGIFWRLLLDPLYYFAEGYASGRIDVEGDLLTPLRVVNEYMSIPAADRPRWFHGRPRSRRHANTLSGARDNIHRHYDLGNAFYRLWLDERMLYTCAYFRDPSMTLEDAQVAKMDHVCRKLQLQPGEQVIEAGCGWGGLALHMARNYGVHVRAYNISAEQVRYARELACQEGLDDRVEFIEDDWRNISGTCDAFVSVGMLEHVGIENYPALGEVIHRSLTPDGRGLIHTIGRNYPQQLDRWIERKIFPGAAPPTLAEMMGIFEEQDFSVLDVENIRLHYAVTLMDWLRRYEDNVDAVRDMFDEDFVRTWRLYLTSSIAAFEYGWLQLFQVVFAPGASNNVPWTRDYQYRDDDTPRGAVWDRLRRERTRT